MRIITSIFFIFLTVATTVPANGASPDTCDKYAKQAINQLREAQSLNLPTPFPEWSDNYQLHYGWCLGQNDKAIAQGTATRQTQIDAAKSSSPNSSSSQAVTGSMIMVPPMQMQKASKIEPSTQKDNSLACSRYAEESVRQNQLNQTLGAGFTGPAWSNDFRAHQRWCSQGDNLRTTPGHLQDREKQLQEFAIKNNKDAARIYAEESVRQNEANKKLGTGFTPPSWSSDFNSHYEWSKKGNNLILTPGFLADRERMLQEAAIKGGSSSAIASAVPKKSTNQGAANLGKIAAAKAAEKSQAPQVKSLSGPMGINKPALDQNLQVVKIEFSIRQGIDLKAPVIDKKVLFAPNPDLCQDLCAKEKECWSFTYVEPDQQGPQAVCYLKGIPTGEIANASCTSGARIPPQSLTMDPNSAEAKAIQQKAALYSKNIEEFWQTAQFKMEPKIANANRKIQEIEIQRINKEHVELLDFVNKSLGSPPLNTAALDEAKLKANVAQMASAHFTSPIAPVQINKAALQSAVLAPEVTGILPVPVTGFEGNENIQEGGYVLLFGHNFGSEAGKVMLTYYEEPIEFKSKVFKEKAVTLDPWKGNWHQAWNDTLIIAKVPILPKGFLSHNASLTLWRDGKNTMKMTIPIRISRLGAGVSSMRTVPEYGDHVNRDAIVFGGEVALSGKSFGDQPGNIYVDLSYPINGLTRVDLLPGKNSWTQSWTDHTIFAKVPQLKANVPTQTAMLVIEPSYGGQSTYRMPISFGPKLVYAMVTGKEFLDLDTSAPDQWVDENGPYLRVAHGPDCTWYRWFGSEGVDHFFKNHQMPDNSRIVQSMVVPVMPDLPWATWDTVIKQVGNLLDAFTGGPVALIEYFGKGLGYAIGSAFDDHVGWYDVNVTKKPSVENPLTRIEWYTTCLAFAPAYDTPAVYISTFLIEGPEGFCPGEIIDLKNSVIK